ncbi:hypothetical protein SAMN02927937_02892 [Paenimyroides aquimaris]|uniref:Uncharacterized protein n=1 Tax=Paenimyroides marinum TaxID=1159016 RepID=A0A1H6N0R2_9FLAO|nr:hypothetical protein SAMN02927937_02892 [Paenimyroides aquimaris]
MLVVLYCKKLNNMKSIEMKSVLKGIMSLLVYIVFMLLVFSNV